MPQQGRVQAPEFQNLPNLQPAPMQSDTYAPPPRPAQNNSAARLQDALSGFSNSVGNLVPVMTEADRRESQWAAERKLQGMTREDYVKAVESGSIPAHADKFTNQAIQGAYGMEYGANRAAEVQSHLSTDFDWDHDDPDAYIASVVKADIDKYGADRNFGSQYLRQMEQARNWALDYREKRKSGQFVQAKQDAAFSVIDVKIDEMIKGGKTPEDIVKTVPAFYKELGKDGTLAVDYDKLDVEFLNKADRLASSDPEVALALLNVTRKGRGGQDVSLSSQREYRDRVINIQKEASKAIGQRNERDFKAKLEGENVRRLKDGDLDFVEDVTYTDYKGEEKTITAKDQKDDAKRLYMRLSDAEAKTNREDPEQKMRREYRAFRDVNEKHPYLEAQLKGIADMASVDLTTGEGATGGDTLGRQKLINKLKTYEWLAGESKNSVIAYTDEKDRDFAESFLMGKKYMKHEDGRTFSDDEAINFAVAASNPLNSKGLPQTDRDAISRAVNSLGTEPGWLWGSNDVAPDNWSTARQKVDLLATRMVNAGANPVTAVKMAAQAIKNSSITYRGRMLDAEGMDIPENFSEVMDSFIDDFAKGEPETMRRNGLLPSDISIEPTGVTYNSGGRFRLIEKDTGIPILDDHGRQKFFTLKQVRRVAVDVQRDSDLSKARDASLQSSAKSRGYVYSTVPGGDDVWVNPKTGEVMSVEFPDDATAPVWKKTGKRQKQLLPK